MKILAIFTCFNRKELTKRGMATLSENRDVTFDYVILDDNSSDGTREMLKQMRDDGTYQIDLIEGDGSNFWNGGMHKAIEHIKNTHMDYDYYMLMNDDTKFFPGIFDEMAPHLKKDEVTVGAICGENGGLSYGGIKYTKGIKYKKLGPDAPEVNCDTFNANCAIIPREIFEKVGIDPFYQHSIGDFDYGLQISKLGYKIHIYPKFVGECNDNTLQKTWQDETLPRMERIRLKESRKGLPFRDAYKATGEIVALCIKKGLTLETLPLEEYKKICDLFDDGVYDAINLDKCVNGRTSLGGPAPQNVLKEAKRIEKILKEQDK